MRPFVWAEGKNEIYRFVRSGMSQKFKVQETTLQEDTTVDGNDTDLLFLYKVGLAVKEQGLQLTIES